MLNLVSSYICVRKEIFTFNILASAKKKHVLSSVSEKDAAAEAHAFVDCISEISEFYRVETTDFVDGYFAKKKKAPAAYKKLRIIIPVMFAAACVLAIVSLAVKGTGAYETLASAYLAFVMGTPVAVFFINELPVYLSAVRSYSYGSAILGDSTPEMMDNMSVVTFYDNDVFTGEGARIKGVKVIDENRIDHIIHYATSVFDIIGGPLAKVFRQAAIDDSKPESAEVRVISSTGVDAMVDGKHIVIGMPQFMEAQCFRAVREAGDEQWEGKTNKRILYLACDEEIIAKFYVEYNVDPDFVYIVRKLSEAGICVGIRTNDPCIDVDIFSKNKITPEQHHIAVFKGQKKSENIEKVSAKKAGIVSHGSVKGLVKTVLVCERLSEVVNINFVIKTVAAFIGFLIMTFVVILGSSIMSVWSLYFALYQLLWVLPIYLISKIYLG